jgi:hypothetical protein
LQKTPNFLSSLSNTILHSIEGRCGIYTSPILELDLFSDAPPFLDRLISCEQEAWGKDELRPIEGGFKTPFCGWAATMVDSLDTLWIPLHIVRVRAFVAGFERR